MKNGSHVVSFRTLAGWTVIEVLIGLAAIAIVIMLGTPVINGLSHDYYLKKTSSNLLSSLKLAQEKAAMLGSVTRLCPSSDGNSCRPDGNWNRGWIVFVDSNANNKPEPVEVVEVIGPPKGNVRIDAIGSFSTSADFGRDGQIVGNNQQASGRFRLCNEGEEPGFQEVLINELGLPEARKSEEVCGPDAPST